MKMPEFISNVVVFIWIVSVIWRAVLCCAACRFFPSLLCLFYFQVGTEANRYEEILLDPFFLQTRKKIRNNNNIDAEITITTAKKQVFHSLFTVRVCVRFVCVQTANVNTHTHTHTLTANGSFARFAHEPPFWSYTIAIACVYTT